MLKKVGQLFLQFYKNNLGTYYFLVLEGPGPGLLSDSTLVKSLAGGEVMQDAPIFMSIAYSKYKIPKHMKAFTTFLSWMDVHQKLI